MPWIKFHAQSLPLPKLTGSPLAVLLALTKRLDPEGHSTITNGTLSKMTGYTRRSIITAVHRLVDVGIIEKVSQAHPRAPLTVRFLTNFALGDADPTEYSITQGGPATND